MRLGCLILLTTHISKIKLICRWGYSLAVWLLRRPIRMAKSRLEKTEEEFNARMAKISAEAKNPNNSQDKPIESAKEVLV